MRLFVVDDFWRELTSGPEPVVRVAADDLQQAHRARARLRDADDGVAVILDIEVAVARDVRAACAALGATGGVRYAGTLHGLAGLLADIQTTGVADGVTLVGAAAPQDLADLGRAVLTLLQRRDRACA